MGRYGEPEEAAAAALYLGSEDASHITGVTLLGDGGFSLFLIQRAGACLDTHSRPGHNTGKVEI